MSSFVKQKPLIITGIIFAIIFVLITIVALKFGTLYKGVTEQFTQKNPDKELVLTKREQIKKVKLRKRGANECIEVGRDGVVRIFKTCDTDELSEVQRSTDLKTVSRLFQLVSETDLENYQQTGDGEVYELTLETENGTQTYYIVITNDTPDIIEIIIDIEEDLPNSSPSLTPSVSIISSSIPSSNPSGSSPLSSPLPSTTPVPGSSPLNPFTCGFSEGGIKPVNVSNIICTGNPSPAP